MIILHRFGRGGAEFALNCDLILTVEATPDTVITLVTGDRLVVAESADDVTGAVLEWRARIGRATFGAAAGAR